MAPRGYKELLSVVVDVSPTMHDDLPAISAALAEFVHKKLLFGKAGDMQLELQLSGSNETDNELNSANLEKGDADQYLQQQVLLPLGPLTRVEVQWAAQLANYAGQRPSNFMDALSVAQSTLKTAKESISAKTMPRIIFISDLASDQCSMNNGDDATFLLENLAPALKDNGITLECHVIPRRPDADAVDAARTAAARHALRSLVENVGGAWYEEPATENMLHAPYTESVAPSTLARVDLEIGSEVKIPIFLFKATTAASVPSLKLYNKLAAGRGEAPKIERVTEFVSADKPDLSLAPDQVLAAYPYGKSVVPIDKAERATIEFKPLPHNEDGSSFKGMQLLGFTAASDLPIYLNLKTADYVLPAPTKSHPSGLWKSGGTDATTAARSAAALSALAHALEETKSVGVVRYSLRKNSELHLGVISPVLNERGNHLVLTMLPFAEDLRIHEFASLPADSRSEPAAEAVAAAEALIDSMMFGSVAAPPNSFAATGDWASLHNPTMRRFYEFMKQLAIQGAQGAVEIPPWDTNALPRALSSTKALAAVNAFNTHAPTRAAEKSKRGGGARGPEQDDAAGDSKRQRDGDSQPAAFGVLSRVKIGHTTAVADFRRELAAASDPSATLDCLEALTQAMFDWATFHGPSDYPLIIECLVAMRRACVDTHTPGMFLTALSKLFQHKAMSGDSGGLWTAIKAAELEPITTDELPGTPDEGGKSGAITAEEARAFMAREPSAEEPAEVETDNEADEGYNEIEEAMD